jgi:glycosyltransferase involved in cell wall biosynthesis
MPGETSGTAAGKDDGRVAVLLGTRNGDRYLGEQLQSLLEQTHGQIDVWASDDASDDATPALLRDWAARWPKGRFEILAGPGRGFAENFRALLINGAIEGDYFAFCDQDDIWEPAKLETALAKLGRPDEPTPKLFCSRTLSIAEDGRPIGQSPLPRREPSFRNALVQSLAGGNTMVLNRSARALIARSAARTSFVSHDWWSYQMVTGAGGVVHYDAVPHVRYRQHGGNQIGANDTWAARMVRLRRLFAGQFYDWTNINLAGLDANRDLLSADALGVIEAFRSARGGSVGARFAHLKRSGVYRQSIYGNLGLCLAIAIGRI